MTKNSRRQDRSL